MILFPYTSTRYYIQKCWRGGGQREDGWMLTEDIAVLGLTCVRTAVPSRTTRGI